MNNDLHVRIPTDNILDLPNNFNYSWISQTLNLYLLQMKILNPLTGNFTPIQSVLRALAAQELCDGEPYDQMMHAADYIDQLEEALLDVAHNHIEK